MTLNWLPLMGNPEIGKNEIKFFSLKNANGKGKPFEEQKIKIIRSDLKFKEGTVEFKVMLQNPKDKVQLLFGAEGDDVLNIGINSSSAAYGIAKKIDGKYEHLSKNGLGVDLPVNSWITVKIKCIGANIELLINDVSVCRAYYNFYPSQLDLLCRCVEDVVIKDFRIQSQLPKAFIVMQFSDEFNVMYTEIIKPVCERFGYDAIRADDMYTNGLLIEDIISSIRESSLVIADITPDNPNVYYEVGFSHAIEKPTILLCDKKRAKLPFDISGLRCIFYENSIAGKSKVEQLLVKHLDACKPNKILMSDGYATA